MPLPPGPNASGMMQSGGVGSAFAAAAQLDNTGDSALDAPFSVLQNRKHQAFPRFTQAEIARMMRFGTTRQWERDDYLCRIGDRAVGMVVVLRGRIRAVLRDGIGRESMGMEQGPGNFACEIGQLSGRAALADVQALEPVEALHIAPDNLRALITAEAELGERIMRALILRRVNLIEKGSGPVLLGSGKRPGLLALQSFLRRNGYPHTVIDAQNDPEAVEVIQRLSPAEEDYPLVLCQDGSILRAPDVGRLASHLGLLPEFDPNQDRKSVV